MHRFVFSAAITLLASASLSLVAACNKPSGGSGGAASSASAASPAKPADAPAANLPTKGPWDAVKITFTKKDADGSPHFKVENTGSKTVTVLFIDYYAYDAKGNWVGHKDLGYNQSLKGGASDDISTSTIQDADTWEAVYHGIKFEGDPKPTTDDKRAPLKRAKGAP